MPSLIRDQLGTFGEAIAAMELSRPAARKYRRALFRAHFLGEKHPVTDYFVEAIRADGVAVGFFLTQVRATMREPRSSSSLSIDVDIESYNLLAGLPMPTYLIGVDLREERSFVIAVSRPRKSRLSTMSTAFDLGDDQVKVMLYDEVCDHWRRHGSADFQSELIDG